jgi:hypothetical protein
MGRKLWVVALALAACQHQDNGGPDLEKLRAKPGALEAARATAAKECRPTGDPSDDCCTALMEVGDALWAQGQKQPAWRAYNEARGHCPLFAPVRRHMFAVRKLASPANEPAPAAMTVNVQVTVDIRLGDAVRLVWYESYFDGERVVQGVPMATTTGLHEVMTELYLEARTPGEPPVRLDAVGELELPLALANESALSGGTTVRVMERPGSALLERVVVETEAVPFRNQRMQDARALPPPPQQRFAFKMLPPTLGSKQRITPVLLPASLTSRSWWSLLKVCVTPEGDVEQATFLRSPDRAMESDLATTVRKWKHRPYLINGAAVAFCYPMRLEVKRSSP